MTHQEMTKHIRTRIKKAGVKARVIAATSCGSQYIKVVTPSYEARWTEEETFQILLIAEANRLTLVRGMPIDRFTQNVLAGKTQWDFYMPVA